MSTPPVALTIAGSDSGGGAGIQADLATFASRGVHGASAVTAVTVQDTTGVHAIHPVPVDVVVAQVECVLHDLHPRAVKVGMLADPDITRAVAAIAAAGRLPNLVVDPVLVSTSGHSLARDGVVRSLLEDLLPRATLITPNTDEAAALLSTTPALTTDEQAEHATALRLLLGCVSVIVTGGTCLSPDGTERVDVLADGTGTRVFRAPEIATTNDHGTGCTFAAAVAAHLAHGATIHTAVDLARTHVRRALTTASTWRLGSGRGPVAHTIIAQGALP